MQLGGPSWGIRPEQRRRLLSRLHHGLCRTCSGQLSTAFDWVMQFAQFTFIHSFNGDHKSINYINFQDFTDFEVIPHPEYNRPERYIGMLFCEPSDITKWICIAQKHLI